MHRFYAPPKSISNKTVSLGADETRHLRDVLRLKPGDDVSVFDGKGREFASRIALISKNTADLSIAREIEPSSKESPLDLRLAVSMLKGEKFDLVVQKAVELGVRSLLPIRTARTEVRSKDSATRVIRWRKIALEASKQSGRAFLMTVEEPIDFEMLLSSANPRECILFAERYGEKFPKRVSTKKLTAIVGPEGGWEDIELAAARSGGIDIVTLGGRIMRAETAAIAVAAILQNRFGDVN